MGVYGVINKERNSFLVTTNKKRIPKDSLGIFSYTHVTDLHVFDCFCRVIGEMLKYRLEEKFSENKENILFSNALSYDFRKAGSPYYNEIYINSQTYLSYSINLSFNMNIREYTLELFNNEDFNREFVIMPNIEYFLGDIGISKNIIKFGYYYDKDKVSYATRNRTLGKNYGRRSRPLNYYTNADIDDLLF